MLHKQFENIEQSSTLKINEISNKLVSEGKTVYKFGLGQSPFPIPKSLIKELKNQSFKRDYLDVSGLLELREAVAKYHTSKNNSYYCSNNVIIGPGSKQLIFQCQMVLNAPLILPKPSWVSYEPQARFLKKPVYWIETFKKDNWHLTKSSLLKHCQKYKFNSSLLILNSPNNPSGTNNENLKDIAEICKINNIIVLSDEIYTELDFMGNYHSLTNFYPEGTIVSSGLSKWCGAGGWRLGTLTFPKKLSYLKKSIKSVASETFTSVSAPIQFAAIKAYTENHSNYLKNSRKVLKIVADFIFEELTACGIDCVRPQGGFYILCDFSKIIKKNNKILNGSMLCEKILEDTGFAMLPGKNFGFDDEKLITRMAYVDFNGKNALTYFNANEFLNEKKFILLFPKIYRGIKTLKNWLIANKYL